jgi:hypothetical protein
VGNGFGQSKRGCEDHDRDLESISGGNQMCHWLILTLMGTIMAVGIIVLMQYIWAKFGCNNVQPIRKMRFPKMLLMQR